MTGIYQPWILTRMQVLGCLLVCLSAPLFQSTEEFREARYDEEKDVFNQNATTGRVLNKVLGDLGDT